MFTCNQLKKIEATFLIVRGCVLSIGKVEAADCVTAFINLPCFAAKCGGLAPIEASIAPSGVEMNDAIVGGGGLAQFVYTLEDYYRAIENAKELYGHVALAICPTGEIPEIEDVLTPLAKIFIREAGLA